MLVWQYPWRLHPTVGLLRSTERRGVHVATRMRLGLGPMKLMKFAWRSAVGGAVTGVVVGMLATTAACGDVGSQQRGIEAGADALQDAAIGDVLPDHHAPQYAIVDGSGDCAPDVGENTVSSCCAGKPCLGFCVALDGGGVGCSCYGIAGGCEADRSLACCTQGHGCDTPLMCAPYMP